MERCFSHSLRALKRNWAHARFLFCALFLRSMSVRGIFFKEGVGGSVFSAETSLFSPRIFRPFINEERGLVSVNGIHGFFTWKRFYFRPWIWKIFVHRNVFRGLLGEWKVGRGQFFGFFGKFFESFLNYFFGGKPVFARVARFFERKEKNKSEISDKKGLTLLKNRL